MKKILFVGYDRTETELISYLSKDYEVVSIGQDVILPSYSNIFDWVISFGYKRIIMKDVIDSFDGNILNLHISYLPWNRGMHPNFWSFYEGTSSGVTIHQVDEGLDTGPIYVQRNVSMDPKKHTFETSYDYLISEMENMFILNCDKILSGNLHPFEQQSEGTFHYKKDLPDNVDWSMNIQEYLDEHKK